MNEVKVNGKVVYKGKYHLILETEQGCFRIEATTGLLKYVEIDHEVVIEGSLLATNQGGIAVVSKTITKEEHYNA